MIKIERGSSRMKNLIHNLYGSKIIGAESPLYKVTMKMYRRLFLKSKNPIGELDLHVGSPWQIAKTKALES